MEINEGNIQCSKYKDTHGSKVLSATRDYYFYYKDDLLLLHSTGRVAIDHARHDGMVYHIDWTSGTESDPLRTEIPGRSWKSWGLDPSTELTLLGNAKEVSVCGAENSLNYPHLPAAAAGFSQLQDVVDKNQGQDIAFDIGGGCKMHWRIRTALKKGDQHYDPQIGARIAEMF
jgi:hypothetical protein